MLLNYNENFCTARKKITEQAHKALFAVYRKNRNISIHVDLQLKLLDSLVSPILLYASEVWGFENKESIEKVHLQWGSPMCSISYYFRNSSASINNVTNVNYDIDLYVFG
jgi:hypothetical protein